MSNRKQKVKTNETFGCRKDIENGVPQNLHLCDLFYFLEDLDIVSYADHSTAYTVKENKEYVINTIEASSLSLFT